MKDTCYLCGTEQDLIPGTIEYLDGEKGRICSKCVQEELKAIYAESMNGSRRDPAKESV